MVPEKIPGYFSELLNIMKKFKGAGEQSLDHNFSQKR